MASSGFCLEWEVLEDIREDGKQTQEVVSKKLIRANTISLKIL